MDNEKESPKVFDNLLFPKIFQTFRMAIQPSKLIIAFLAVAAICLAGWIMDFSKPVVAIQDAKGKIVKTELQVYMENVDAVQSWIQQVEKKGERTGVFSEIWHFASGRFHSALKSLFAFNLPGVAANIRDYFRAVGWACRYHPVYSIIFAVIKLVVISITGGAICRIAALQFAQDEKPGLTEALRYSAKRFISFFTAPLAPIAIIIFIGFFIFLLGLVGNIPKAGELIMGIFMVLAFIAGALIAVVAIGAVAGFNLMFPAVAYDNSDCFDAISRAFSYVYAKPWRMGFYTAIAAVYGAICYIFVRFFAFLLLLFTHKSLQLGIFGGNKKLEAIWQGPIFTNLVDPPDLTAANWAESFAAVLVYLLLLAVIGLVVAFIISFYFSANTIIYSLMRNRVDNTALDDIYREVVEEAEPETTAAESEPEQTEPEEESQNQPESEE